MMTTYELLKANENLISMMQQLMHQYGVTVSDIRYLEMYKEYIRMVDEGHKITYIIAYLSDEYKISNSTVYRVIDKFSSDVKV